MKYDWITLASAAKVQFWIDIVQLKFSHVLTRIYHVAEHQHSEYDMAYIVHVHQLYSNDRLKKFTQ